MKLVQMKLVYPLVLLLFITKNDRMASATGGIFPPGISIATPDNEAMESSDESVDLCDSADEKSQPYGPMKDYYVQHTMYRIRDPRASLPFYTDALGMTLLHALPTNANFTLYFLGYEDADDIPIDVEDRAEWAMTREGTVQLQHIWGSENSASFEYHNGNSFPLGYGHIGIVVPDVYGFCHQLALFNVTFMKNPDEGNVKGNAFILDPDGYWIEILNPLRLNFGH